MLWQAADSTLLPYFASSKFLQSLLLVRRAVFVILSEAKNPSSIERRERVSSLRSEWETKFVGLELRAYFESKPDRLKPVLLKRKRGQSCHGTQTCREVVLAAAHHSLVRADGSHARQLEGHPGPEPGIDSLLGNLDSAQTAAYRSPPARVE